MSEPDLALARRLLTLGLSVIPIPRPRPGVQAGQPGDGKVPAIPWGEFQGRFANDDELRQPQWFGGVPANIGIVTGALSGVVVVDCDSLDAVAWWIARRPRTPWQTITARGYHLFYRHPGGRVPNRARIATGDRRLLIDIRGDGGFVIAPGSVHASGHAYRFAGDWNAPRERLPIFWAGWLERPARPTPPALRPRPSGDIIDRARAYLAAIPKPEIGHGSDAATLSAACRLTRGFWLMPAVAEDLLWEWCGNRPGWTREWVAEKVAHAIRYGTEPVGALR